MIWNFSVNCIYLISFVIIPFVIINPKELQPPIRWLELTFDMIFFIDITIDLFTAYYEDTQLITDLKQIWVKYLSSYFIFDILSILPGLITGESYHEIYYLKVLRYAQFTRLIDLFAVAINRVMILA
jgi:Ion transport protein